MPDQQKEVLEMEDVNDVFVDASARYNVTPINNGVEFTRLTPERNVTIKNENVETNPNHIPIPNAEYSESLYFDDGIRKIDYVLAYSIGADKDTAKRAEFELNLQKCDLQLEYEDSTKFDSKTCFVKIHAPWEFLATQAEVLKLKMPIKKNDIEMKAKVGAMSDCVDRMFSSCWHPCKLDEELIEEPDYFTAVFSRQMEDQFIIDDKQTFFSNAQRSRMVWDMLIRTNYDRDQPLRVGINRLLKNGSYLAAYPLHDGFSSQRTLRMNGEIESKISPRQILYQTWAKPSMFYKFQPLDVIRTYFGEKIAIYFAWLGFYTKALIPAALVGIFCLVFGAATLSFDTPSIDICNETGVGAIDMCPSCDNGCKVWKLSQSCNYSKVTHLFDNWFTVIFAACMSIWATLFLEGWKRNQAALAWDWDLTDYGLEEDVLRPEFQIRVKTKAENPITKEWEPFLPFKQRVFRILGSCVTVFFFLLLVLAFVVGVIVYRIIITVVLEKHNEEILRMHSQIITSITAALLNLICIMLLDWVYKYLAWKLTSWEYPRTESQFEDSYTFKVFLFQFINYNSSLFYIAFFKGKFTTVPNDTKNDIFGYPPEKCDTSGCMVELLIQLAIIMTGKQMVGNFMEILFPVIWNKWRTCCGKKVLADGNYTRWEKDYDLNAVPPMNLFEEYLEMVIQYGFVTLFVAAFPLAPLFALINNIIEVRLDAYKFTVAYRRPMPARAQGLGVWYDILDGISKLAVLTNACVIAFTSDFVPRLVYRMYYSLDRSLDGYMQSELSYYDTSSWCLTDTDNNTGLCNISYCRFPDYRKSPCSLERYNVTIDKVCGCDEDGGYHPCIKWWHVLAAKLAFILVFEHLVFLIKGSVAYLIPDTPREVLVQMQREAYLAKQAFYKHELACHMEDKEKIRVMSEGAVTSAKPLDQEGDNPNKDGVKLRSNKKSPRDAESNAFYTPSESMSSLEVIEDKDGKTTKF